MKRILSLVLTAAMLLSLVTMTVFASWTEENTPVAVLSVEGVDGADCDALVPGDEVKVSLKVSGLNIYWSGVSAQLNYDAEKFALENDETDVSSVQALFGACELNAGTPGEVVLASAVSALVEDDYDSYLRAGSEELLEDIVIITAVFSVKSDAAVGDAEFTISTSDEDDARPYRLAFTQQSKLEAVTTSTDDLSETVAIVEAPAFSAKIGDVNLDAVVDMDDVILLLRHVAEMVTITDSQSLKNGEVTGDTNLNMDDVIKILRYVAEMIDSLE